MQENDDPAADETVSRVLIRDDEEAASDRPIRDEDDFLRRERYGPRQIPENGLSVFRRKLVSADDIYRRLSARKKKGKTILLPLVLGLATCKFGALKQARIQHHVEAGRPEHVSIRCPDCDMEDTKGQDFCRPAGTALCPCFARTDPLNLADIFSDDEPPRLRTHGEDL